jgi:hypothetical protein
MDLVSFLPAECVGINGELSTGYVHKVHGTCYHTYVGIVWCRRGAVEKKLRSRTKLVVNEDVDH